MRKKSFLLFVILCCITILVACVFVACNPDNKNQGDIGEKIKFTLTFDVDGAAYAKIQTAGNEIIALPDNPVKDGYVFDGWYWDKNVWSQPFTVTSLANQPLASDMTVYAKWITEEESRIGVVNFVTNGGSVVSPIRTGILEISPVTVRSGYILEGWYTTATLDDDTKVSFPLQVSGDMCLYAKWNIVEYSIRYVTGGGRLPSETPYEYTIETQTVLPVPDREGYTFVGWYENEDFSGPQTAVITVGQIGEKTFYARWQINEYTITFDSMGGSEVDSVRGDFGTPVAAPVSPVQKGYDFVGWFTDRTYEEEFVFDNMPAESITLYAKWSAVEYDLIYHTFDGLMPDGAQYKYTIEDEFTLPIPSKDYYTFAGWFDNADLQGTPIVSINEGNTGNKELWAKWDATAYSIKYNLDGGINGNNPPSYNTEDETIVLATPRKTGYSFVGWYDNSKFEGEAVSEIASGSSGNKEFWAKWEINQYVISFETNGGSVIEDAEYDFGAQVVCPTAPVRAGYIFEGWYSSEDLSQTYTFGKMPAEDIKIYAKWSIEIYDIIYDADNADLPVEAVFTYTVEDEVPLPLIEKEGYTFEGWFDNEQFEGNSIEQIAAGTTGDLYLFAKFVINQYTITFDTDGGSEIAAVTQDFGTAIDAPEQPVKNGYTFGGWFIDETLSEELVFDTMPAQSITVYAKWVPIEYSIAYMVNGGVMPSDYITSYTVEDYIALPAPEKTGYTFIGWFETEELSGEASFEIFVGSTGDKTYFAGYIINQYTITFAVNGGSDIESVTQDYNSLIVEPSSPSRTGYRFEGWFADSECTTEFVFDRMPADNITVYAKWSTISYTITYHNVDDAENTNPTVYTVEDEIELLNPVKNGYTFDYWYLNGDVYDKISEIKSGTTGNLDIYASWIKADNGYAIVSAPDYAFVSDTELKTIVEQNVTELDFRGTFTVSPNAGWRVFTEENCSQPSELTLRTATNLQEGDNYYYILVENNSTYLSQVYTVNVYRKHLYTVNLYSKSGSIGQSFELVEGNSVTEEAIDASFDLVDVGYRLTGWYFDSDYTEEYAIGTSINKNQSVINLYPKYEPLTYQIKYELDGGINSESNPSQYNVEDGNITLEQPTKDGWTFDGWWLESTFENPIEIIEISAPRSYVVYAKWVPFVFEETENGELIVLSYNGEYENVSIPDSVYGKAVVGVGASAFANCTGLKSLTIPDSITTIGEQAFSGCGSLTLITIPDSVTSIGQGAFSGCSALEQITIPFVGAEAGKTSSDTYQYPFGYIFGTSSYTGGTEVTQYYYGSSTGNTTFATYYIPSSLRKVTVAGGNILYGAFYNCSMLTSITSPENVTSIGAYAFYNCSSLTLVTIGNGVTSIGKSAFSGCSALTSIYYAGDMPSWLGKTWHSNVMASGRMLYIDGNKVEGEITIPEGVSSIPSYAFAYQTGITSVTISDSVTSIGNSAFYGCYTLVEVYNKSQLNILAGSSGNGYVAYYAKNVCTNEDDAQLTTDENGFIFYYDGTVGYLVGYTGADGEIVLPDGFTAYDGTVVNSYGIYKYAFYNFSGLTSITIGNSVTSIGDYAFYGCICFLWLHRFDRDKLERRISG